jgi:hypothetical protein
MDKWQHHHIDEARIFRRAYRPSVNLVQFLKSIIGVLIQGSTTVSGDTNRFYSKKKKD